LNGECLSDRQCPKCRKRGHTLKKFHIWRFPHILVIHLKRFERHTGKLDKKLQNYVDFPLEGLNLGNFVTAPAGSNVPTSTSPTLFDLFAVTNHYGTMDGGHYTAYCRNKGMT
jgi:ubiquitin carboxyl-terminal hydrolase 8